MDIRDVEKRIFECPKHRVEVCPVAKKFKEVNGELPIPEAYLGNPKAKFMIIGINPGQSVNYLDHDFEVYQSEIRGFLKTKWKGAWAWDYVIEIFGYPPREKDGVIITNLVHCPTPSWGQKIKKTDQWYLVDEKREEAIKLCNHFCFDIVEKVDPELILLHGPDVVKFFSDHYGWSVEDSKSMDITGDIKKGDGRKYVLSQHLVRLIFCSKNPQKSSHKAWQKLKDAATTL